MTEQNVYQYGGIFDLYLVAFGTTGTNNNEMQAVYSPPHSPHNSDRCCDFLVTLFFANHLQPKHKSYVCPQCYQLHPHFFSDYARQWLHAYFLTA